MSDPAWVERLVEEMQAAKLRLLDEAGLPAALRDASRELLMRLWSKGYEPDDVPFDRVFYEHAHRWPRVVRRWEGKHR